MKVGDTVRMYGDDRLCTVTELRSDSRALWIRIEGFSDDESFFNSKLTLIVFNIAREKAAPQSIRFAAAKLFRSIIFLTVES